MGKAIGFEAWKSKIGEDSEEFDEENCTSTQLYEEKKNELDMMLNNLILEAANGYKANLKERRRRILVEIENAKLKEENERLKEEIKELKREKKGK